jgi:SprT protein
MQNNVNKYIPEASIELVVELLNRYPHELKIVNKRDTKHGDFRLVKSGVYQITINNSLNKYQFLLTLIHEIAHLVTHLQYQRVKPHGIEWKISFQHLMLPFVNPEIFPTSILPYLANYLKNPKASTDTDVHLALAMKQFNEKSNKYFIFEVPLNAAFLFKNKKYIRKKKRRTRFECLELNSKRLYLFNQNVEVELVSIK